MRRTMGARTLSRVSGLAAALWWGSLTTIGFLVVPLLFAYLPSPALAGNMAARLFTAQTWLSVACAGLLLMLSTSKHGHAHAERAQNAMLFIILGMLMALLVEFAVAPRIVARDNLKLWHAIGSGMYLVQWLCALVVWWRMVPPERARGQL